MNPKGSSHCRTSTWKTLSVQRIPGCNVVYNKTFGAYTATILVFFGLAGTSERGKVDLLLMNL
ncbi:MAG: hypothetical protein PHS17_06205 [Desulfobacterales bacterium]|nr:hypothetical protein [Desulfobacterales bacterium]